MGGQCPPYNYDADAANPLCLNNGSVSGSRPRNFLNTSMGCKLPPKAVSS
ncbi:MAG: hypothetical protein AB4368_11695 [Xenococcaceae cyanobacterium]